MFALKKIVPATLLASTLAVGFSAVPATAQQNQQRGLVNVAVFEVIDSNPGGWRISAPDSDGFSAKSGCCGA